MEDVREDEEDVVVSLPGVAVVVVVLVAMVFVVPVEEQEEVESRGVVPTDGVDEVFSGMVSGDVSSVVGSIKLEGGRAMVEAHEMIVLTATSTGITSAVTWP